jgi:hypothetical protein
MLGRLATERHIRCPGEDSRLDHTDIGRIFWVAPPWSTRTASPDWKLGSFVRRGLPTPQFGRPEVSRRDDGRETLG